MTTRDLLRASRRRSVRLARLTSNWTKNGHIDPVQTVLHERQDMRTALVAGCTFLMLCLLAKISLHISAGSILLWSAACIGAIAPVGFVVYTKKKHGNDDLNRFLILMTRLEGVDASSPLHRGLLCLQEDARTILRQDLRVISSISESSWMQDNKAALEKAWQRDATDLGSLLGASYRHDDFIANNPVPTPQKEHSLAN